MIIHFLEASEPLTKSFTLKAGELVKTPYPMTWEFTSHSEQVSNLKQFEAALNYHAQRGHCLIKGTLNKQLLCESRAGSTATGDLTQFIVLDLDGLSAPSIQMFLDWLELSDVSYIVQWSASYGIENNLLRAHIIILLKTPMAAPLLKQWLIQKNHEVSALNSAMTLTKTGNSIRWPLDISACQNDKLIYIAPPVLGKGVKDPMARQPRIQLVQRKLPCLDLNASVINSTDKNRALTTARILALREAAGLPKRKITYKMHGTTEVMVKPDTCVITEMKQERGFVYFNLNGGDSWAYYHPENNPDYIYSFKGEPAYLTKELLPDYWEQLVNGSNGNANSKGIVPLAFCDRLTATYWRGTYNQATDHLDITMAKNEKQVRDAAKQMGLPLGDFIPEWEISFDPHDNVRVDPQNRTINLFQLTSYMRAIPNPKAVTIPKTIKQVIHHVVGSSDEAYNHFINWLAFIVQKRDRTRTAWVLHGTTGTGKGVLLQKILRPLFGDGQVTHRRSEELDEKYNHFMQNALIVVVDEIQADAMQNAKGAMAKMKTFITEPIVPIRKMHMNATEVRNYSNWIFFSNMPEPVRIAREDRRFNVGAYQPNKLPLTNKEIDDHIEKELQAFYDYLHNFPLDEDMAHTVLQSEDRDAMVSVGESSIDTTTNALIAGDFEFFIDQLPTSENYRANTAEMNRVENYKDCLKALLERANPQTGKCTIARDELRTLIDYTVGGMPQSPNKFTSLLKHHRIAIHKVHVAQRGSVNGFSTTWNPAQLKAAQAVLNPPAKPPSAKVVPLSAAKTKARA